MQRSIYLAKLIGPVSVAMGVGMLLNAPIFRILAEQFLSSYALIFLAGLLTLTAGIALVLAHNVWVPDWRLIITLLGWLSVIGGTFRIVAPNLVVRIGDAVISHGEVFMVAGFAVLVLGGVLSYFGYADTGPSPSRAGARRTAGKRSRRT
jgi:hypothetical protein